MDLGGGGITKPAQPKHLIEQYWVCYTQKT